MAAHGIKMDLEQMTGLIPSTFQVVFILGIMAFVSFLLIDRLYTVSYTHLDQILSCVDEKTKIFKQDIVENKNLCFEGLSIDKYRRVVILSLIHI